MKKINATPSIDRFATRKFIKNPFDLGWELMYESLVKYRDKYGNYDIPKTYSTKEGLNLGNWADRQIRENINGNLDTVKVKRLKEIGFLL